MDAADENSEQASRTHEKLTLENFGANLEDYTKEALVEECRNLLLDRYALSQEHYHLGEKLDSMGMVAGTLAHDLNNILAPIRLGVQFLRRSHKEQGAGDVLSMIESSIDHASTLVDQISTFAHGIQGERSIIHLRQVLRDLTRVVERTFPRTIRFESKVPDNLPSIRANYTQIYQVLMNLCLNSRDAMPEGGHLELSGEARTVDGGEQPVLGSLEPGRYLCVTVRDTGCGIAEDRFQKIFEPYYTSKKDARGSGLGLSSVARIIKSHEGAVCLQSQEGEGTSFRIYLPAAMETPSRKQAEVAPESHAEASSDGDCERPEIVVVDDERSMLDMLAEMLRFHGHRVATARTGEECLTLLQELEGDVRLVILDMMMPGLDGLETAQRLRQQWANLPLLLMSGVASQKRVERAQDELGVGFLPKPFREEDLLKAIKPLL